MANLYRCSGANLSDLSVAVSVGATSDTITGVGTVIYSGQLTNYFAWQAFNGCLNANEGWGVRNATATGWLGIHFTNAKDVFAVLVAFGNNANIRLTSLKLQYSDDGITWSETDGYKTPDMTKLNMFQLITISSSYGSHNYWRIYGNNTLSTEYAGVSELNFLAK